MKMKRNTKAAGSTKLVVTNSGPLRSLIRRNNDGNLQKLGQLGILDKFVQENNGTWDHQKWIDLCVLIEKLDIGPVDFDKVGLMLEEKKARHLFFHQIACAQTEHADLADFTN